jgi:hypothetical protein
MDPRSFEGSAAHSITEAASGAYPSGMAALGLGPEPEPEPDGEDLAKPSN